jgi:hypothetical protein
MQDRESELFGLIEAWSQKLDIPIADLTEKLKDATFVEVRMHDQSPLRRAYMESDVRRVCADLLTNE